MGFAEGAPSSASGSKMDFLHSHVFWRVPKPVGELPGRLPQRGDELWIRIPADQLFLVTR